MSPIPKVETKAKKFQLPLLLNDLTTVKRIKYIIIIVVVVMCDMKYFIYCLSRLLYTHQIYHNYHNM